MVIFGFSVETMSADFIDFLASRKVMLGFLRKNRPITIGLRNELFQRGLTIIDNLAIPHDLDVTQSGLTYYGYMMVFAPFVNGTSRFRMGFLNEYVNLAELVLLSATKEMKELCSDETYRNPLALNHDWFAGPNSEIPMFTPGQVRPQLSQRMLPNGKTYDWLKFSDHYGSHLDAPYHFIYQGYSTDTLPSRYTLAPCIKITSEMFPVNATLDIHTVRRWERRHNRTIPEGAIVILDTGYSINRWTDSTAYLRGFPGIAVEATEWLLNQRKIVALGIDSPSLDAMPIALSGLFPSHVMLAQSDGVAVLNLNSERLHWLPESGGTCLLVFFRAEKGTSSPCVLFAHVNASLVSSATEGVAPSVTLPIQTAFIVTILITAKLF